MTVKWSDNRDGLQKNFMMLSDKEDGLSVIGNIMGT